jgi:hypothetical protein
LSLNDALPTHRWPGSLVGAMTTVKRVARGECRRNSECRESI